MSIFKIKNNGFKITFLLYVFSVLTSRVANLTGVIDNYRNVHFVVDMRYKKMTLNL